MIWCYWEERLNVGGRWLVGIWFDVFEKDTIDKARRAEAPPACIVGICHHLMLCCIDWNIIAQIINIVVKKALTISFSTSPNAIIQTNNIAHSNDDISAAISITFVPVIVVNNKVDNIKIKCGRFLSHNHY